MEDPSNFDINYILTIISFSMYSTSTLDVTIIAIVNFLFSENALKN